MSSLINPRDLCTNIRSIWYCGTGSGTIVGALVSFGFQHYESTTFKSWQIMFLVCGMLTVAVGITVILVLPDNPMSAKFLTHNEKVWAIERLRANQTGIENKHFKLSQAIECFKDPQTYFLVLITITSNIPNGFISSYQATIIKGFGYTSKQTALLSIPSGAVSIVSILLATNVAGRFNQRALNIVCLLIPGVIGAALIAFLPAHDKAGKLIGNYMTNTIGAALPLIYSFAGANYAGHTKKVSFLNAVVTSVLTLSGHNQCGYSHFILSRKYHRSSDIHRGYSTWVHSSQNRDNHHICRGYHFDLAASGVLCAREQEA